MSAVTKARFKLDNAPGFIYEKMAIHLEKRIESGELQPGTPLPSERRLADDYGVSLGTARHATRLLRDSGTVITVRSKGTYVAPRRVAAPAPPDRPGPG